MMFKQTKITMTMMRVMVLLAMMMAAIVVLSGPVAGVLDLPEPTAEAKKKKKKKKRPPVVMPAPAPTLNTVECRSVMTDPICEGTPGNDNMIGISTHNKNISALAGNDLISAGVGDDTTDGGAGDDTYSYKEGWGTDTLTDASGTDHLNFSAVGSTEGVYAILLPEIGGYNYVNGPNGARINLSSDSVIEKVTGSSKFDGITTGGANNTLQPGPGTGGAGLRDQGGRSDNIVSIPVSNDTYSGFAASGYGPVYIEEYGGTADKLVLPFASTDVYFEAENDDDDPAVDNLLIMTSSTDSVYIYGQLEPYYGTKGHIEQIQFTDGTFKIGSETPQAQTLSSAKAADSPESQVAELNEASNLDANEKEKRSEAAKKTIEKSKQKKEGSGSAKKK